MKTVKTSGVYIYYFVVATLLLFMSSMPALAQVNFTTDEEAFNASNQGLSVQDFQSGNAGPGSVTECGAILNQNTNDACFAPGDILPGIEFFASSELSIAGPGFNNNPFIALVPNFDDDALDITFPGNTVNTAGVDLGCLAEGLVPCSADVFVRVFGEGDSLIGSTTIAVTSLFDSFLGIRSAVPITRINVSSDFGTETFDGIDRISFGLVVNAIPTLSEWGIIAAASGLAMVGVFFAVRKRRAEKGSAVRI